MILHGHRCDHCGRIDTAHPDDGTPTGWVVVAQMDSPGCWGADAEWHLCSLRCLRKWEVPA